MMVDKNGMCTLSEEDCSYHSCNTKQTNKLTNGDRHRARTDEELAEVFSHFCCPYVFGGNVECNAENKGCKGCWLDWLKSEVDIA